MAKDRKAVSPPAVPPRGASPSVPFDGPLPPPAPPACANCKHFIPVQGEEALGRCRRFPPSSPPATITAHGSVLTHLLVLASDRCGEHSPA